MTFKSLLLAASITLVTAGCTRAADNDPFGAKVREYLLKHPEVIEEAVEKLQAKREAAAVAEAEKALESGKQALHKEASLRQQLERDPRDFVHNPDGKITVTEFFDYRCAHCINATPKVMQILKDNPDVRFVFKEMPIFGDTSEHAARAAIAVKNSGGDYLDLYRTFMTTRGLNDEQVDKIARSHGVDPEKTERGPLREKADSQIAEVHELAKKLSVGGTPTFIIGDVIVPGEDMDAVKAAIATARKGVKS
jgi:protein-disulfide isomerase